MLLAESTRLLSLIISFASDQSPVGNCSRAREMDSSFRIIETYRLKFSWFTRVIDLPTSRISTDELSTKKLLRQAHVY